MNGTDYAIQFILNTTWAGLPEIVQHQARRCLLDAMGALISGTDTPVARLMADFAVEQFTGSEATLLVSGRKASLVGATLANGFAANSLDIDDGYRPIKGHPGVCVLPALLAAAERQAGVSGQAFLTAFVIGYEIGIRAGLIRHATYPTYHSSGSWGAMAAAAAAGKIFGLEAGVLRQALGAAEYHAPIAPMMKGIDTPSMGKDSIGWGAMAGMASVLMAQRGFTGVEPLFSDAPNPAWLTGLGKQYEVLNLYFKPYASCRWAQPAIAGALEIARQHRLAPADIARIKVYTFEAAARLTRKPPQNTEEAQYHLTYPVAAALIDGQVGPRQVTPPRLFDPAILALAERVEVEVVAKYERVFPAKTLADVEVITTDGRRLLVAGKQALWEPPDSLPSDAELEQKFRWLVEPVLGQERAGELVDLIWRFEQVHEARDLIELAVV
ncbi:MAG: MmgE/PrpD family protein [Anaerolineales bacterium]|nr:MmgE/PrpD family protein [Anaerolineales bacterium]